MPPTAKTQRWIDLLAALLGRHAAISFEEIQRDVPAYQAGARDSVKRMFERDKRELRALGIPLESESAGADAEYRYRIRTTDFYLPYLTLLTPAGVERPRPVGRHGYRSLESLAFDADELRAVSEGAARAMELGNPALAADAVSAIRKLAVDLPVGGVASPDDVRVVPAMPRADHSVLERLAEALHARKRVTFTYHAQGSDTTTTRVVEPYGLFAVNGHWYLVAHDLDRHALRNFRTSRIQGARQQSPDRELPEYVVAEGFDLRQHARSRQAWELGDSEATAATVRFTGRRGATRAAARLGAAVEGDESLRSFAVRRPDAFVRWLLSFAGEAEPVAPPSLRALYEEQVQLTLAVYERSAS
jgi:proteasome accessory factor B